MKVFIYSLLFLISYNCRGQSPSLDISAIVFLDSFVVSASKQGFDVADFIDLVQRDQSFYQAFHNNRFQYFTAKNLIKVFDKKKKLKATYDFEVQQNMDGNCRTMDYLEEKVSGPFFKNKKTKKHRYYTAKMQEEVFLTKGKICGNPNSTLSNQVQAKGIQKHINELKKLIFQPGEQVDVPFIGKKTAIFDKKMLRYYDFYIESKPYKNQGICYIFKAIAKSSYPSSKTIIKYLETYFDKTNFQVVARNYHLHYKGIFDFDVKMNVELDQLEGKYLPSYIHYKGSWKIPMKKRENVTFQINYEY